MVVILGLAEFDGKLDGVGISQLLSWWLRFRGLVDIVGMRQLVIGRRRKRGG